MNDKKIISIPEVTSFFETLLLEDGLAKTTIDSYELDLISFNNWLDKNSSKELLNVTSVEVLKFLSTRADAGLSSRSTARLISCLRRFYRYLLRERLISKDPTSHIKRPKQLKSLPKALTFNEIERLLQQPDLKSPLGIRNRTMLELMYSSGLRVSELITLQVDQISRDTQCTRLTGKGNKERLVPFGQEAAHWLDRYFNEARSKLLIKPNNFLFLSRRGTALTRQMFWVIVKDTATQAGIKKTISPHALRHSFATHLVDHGADLRSVQLLMGHSNISTTQVYIQVAKARLQKLHAEHHPRG